MVIVSDEMEHNSSTVLTVMEKIVMEIKDIQPNVECIHYWTDSPTSQYRNKLIFDAVANHEERYGMKARWNYFEAGQEALRWIGWYY
ncbi:hypothetical protein SNE40_021235 [Patella caerulea]|uniref:Uncharacterized protein n=1 Tax=Patella caerulea TaxID=87958 RepID=A0AAN8FZ23_PATCE